MPVCIRISCLHTCIIFSNLSILYLHIPWSSLLDFVICASLCHIFIAMLSFYTYAIFTSYNIYVIFPYLFRLSIPIPSLYSTLGQNKGSHGYTNVLHYVDRWATVWFLLKSCHWHGKLQNLVLHLFITFDRFSIERFYFEFFRIVSFCQFLSYRNVIYIKIG